jgi:cyanophycinase-like exopeptidase
LILQAWEGNDYAQTFYRHSRFAAVQEIFVPPCARALKVDAVAAYVDRADAVLFAGGDQAHYVAWKGSALIRAVRRVYARGGIEGGGSAGLAIQGSVVYDAVAADRVLPGGLNLDSRRAARDPFGPAVSFTTGLFAWPPLAATITDSHFARRDRFGRLAAFMARAFHDRLVGSDPVYGDRVYGLGIDEGSALVVDGRGVATLHEATGTAYRSRGAYLLSGGAASRIAPGRPLLYTVDVVHLQHSGETYDLRNHRGGGARYRVTVDGSHANIYSRNPYQ